MVFWTCAVLRGTVFVNIWTLIVASQRMLVVSRRIPVVSWRAPLDGWLVSVVTGAASLFIIGAHSDCFNWLLRLVG